MLRVYFSPLIALQISETFTRLRRILQQSYRMVLPPDENKGPTLIAIIWGVYAIATFFVCCRIYTRVRLIRSPWLDDAVIVLSLVSML